MLLFFLFVLGAQIGSFLNVCIWRLPRRESIAYPPSHCPHCNTRLRALDLVPLLSQLWLRGRCRYCQTRFSWRYFGVEALTGALFVLAGIHAGTGAGGWTTLDPGDLALLARDLIFMATLVVVFFVDYDTRLIQLESVFLLGLAGLLYDAWTVHQNWAMQHLLPAGLVPAGSLFGVLPGYLPGSLLALAVTAAAVWLARELASWAFRREALGFGDVLLVAAIAANLGWHATLFTFFFCSVVLGASIGVALRLPHAARAARWARQRQRRYGGRSHARPLALRAFRTAMPFGPMLAIGAVAALLYGNQINSTYLNLMLPPGAAFSVPLPLAPAPGSLLHTP